MRSFFIVYGSLRKDESNYLNFFKDKYYLWKSGVVKEAAVYDIGPQIVFYKDYPNLVERSDSVIVDLFYFDTDTFCFLLPIIDKLEFIDLGLYRRDTVEVEITHVGGIPLDKTYLEFGGLIYKGHGMISKIGERELKVKDWPLESKRYITNYKKRKRELYE